MPVGGIGSNFALRDDAIHVGVDEFHRVFDGDDVPVTVRIAMSDHCRQRGRFAGAGRADHDDQSALGHHDIFELWRYVQRIKLRNFGGDGSNDHAGFGLLHESGDAKPADVLRADREIAFMR